jgi:F-box/leucine-rich repeat protein 2/20
LTTLSLQYSNREKIFHPCLYYMHQFVTDESLQVLSDNCTQLTALDLSGCPRITDTGLESLSKCVMLRRLHLDGCNEITGDGLFSLAFGCKNLEILSLGSCAINNDDLEYLVYPSTGSNCSKLQKLDLHDSNVSVEGIRILCHCTQLRSLNLSDSPNIDDNCLQCLSNHCSMLEHLNLNNCVGVTDKGILKLAKGCHQLKSIKLQECNITVLSLQHLSKECILLKYLDISYYGKITMPQIREGQWLRNGLTIKFKKV